MKRKITPETDAQIVAGLNAGEHYMELARKYKVCPARIYRAREWMAERALVEELIPVVRRALDFILPGRCDRRVRKMILKRLAKE